ncbi:hypothetical protein BJV78DRAFT_1202106 [Lactifluus subvellereus]|nr:hypothetical protein BJV78DRAFT_1202106 [Lactifluus subvellereus]
MHLLPFLATLVIIRGETNGRHHLRPTGYPKPLPKVLFIMDQWHLRALPTLTCRRLTVLLLCHAAIGTFATRPLSMPDFCSHLGNQT